MVLAVAMLLMQVTARKTAMHTAQHAPLFIRNGVTEYRSRLIRIRSHA